MRNKDKKFAVLIYKLNKRITKRYNDSSTAKTVHAFIVVLVKMRFREIFIDGNISQLMSSNKQEPIQPSVFLGSCFRLFHCGFPSML